MAKYDLLIKNGSVVLADKVEDCTIAVKDGKIAAISTVDIADDEAKEILAYELTKLVHGDEEADKAREASHALFAGGGNNANMPTIELSGDDFADGDLDIMSVLVKAGLCESRGDARRNVQQGGVSVADEKVTDISTKYAKDAFAGDGLIVRRGKKKFAKVVVK